MNKSESIKEIATALCAFQGAVEKIKKGNTNPFFKSKYASLSDILDVIRQPLSDNKLSFVQFPKGEHELETMLMHSSGEWMSETYKMKPTKDDPQGAGSVITYQRRYALGAILGLNIDEDTDGNEKTPEKKAETKEALTPTHKNWDKVVAYLKEGGKMSGITQKYTLSKEVERTLVNLIPVS